MAQIHSYYRIKCLVSTVIVSIGTVTALDIPLSSKTKHVRLTSDVRISRHIRIYIRNADINMKTSQLSKRTYLSPRSLKIHFRIMRASKERLWWADGVRFSRIACQNTRPIKRLGWQCPGTWHGAGACLRGGGEKDGETRATAPVFLSPFLHTCFWTGDNATGSVMSSSSLRSLFARVGWFLYSCKQLWLHVRVFVRLGVLMRK